MARSDMSDLEWEFIQAVLPNKSRGEPPRVYRRVKLSKGEPMTTRRHTPAYPGELRERGVRLFRENRAEYASDTAAYKAIAPKLGCSPDSPDLNPVEMAFSKLKAHLRRIGARTFDQLIEAIGEICNLFAPDECWNFFKAAGYAS